jgi:hypothetical protein
VLDAAMPLLIAVQACILILNLDIDYYAGWVEVIVYPDEFVPAMDYVDEDGIVCVPSVRGEQPAADRLRELLIKAYGKTWSPAGLSAGTSRLAGRSGTSGRRRTAARSSSTLAPTRRHR